MGIFSSPEPSQTEDNSAIESFDSTTDPNTESETATGTVRNSNATMFAVLRNNDLNVKLARNGEDLRQSIRDVRMVRDFRNIAQENSLSAPVVAAFHATPGFSQAVTNFPDATQFDVIPEDQSSAKYATGLESFEAASVTASDVMTAKLANVASVFGDILTNLPATVESFQQQVSADVEAIGNADLSDDVLATLQVNSIDEDKLNAVLDQIDTYVSNITPIDTSALAANPETLMAEAKGLTALIDDAGPMLGLSFDTFGLRTVDQDAEFEQTQGTFGEKGYTVAGLNLLLSRSETLLSSLGQLADQKDELIAGMAQAVSDTPTEVDSDDVTYGSLDHVTLANSYVTLTSSLINQGTKAVAMVLGTVNAALDTSIVE